MSLTLLLDLDDTLLTNPMDQFVAAYMKALAGHVAPYTQPERFLTALLAATQHMAQNQDPNCLLKEIFDDRFFPALGMQPVDLSGVISSFYSKVFPTLKDMTEVRPAAVALVKEAVSRDYRMVIATNPLFPLTAIEQRLEWAGLPPAEYPFALIPSYEHMHFAKPNPAYLAELLALLGWPEEPAVMVGNDLKSDIDCARRLGLPSFHILEETNGSEAQSERHPSGSLSQIIPWIDSTPAELLAPDFSSPTAMLAILRSTPAAISSLSQRLSANTWTQRTAAGEWCLTEIVCHLRDVEAEVNIPRLQKVISESNPFIPGQDTDRWAEERGYINQNGRQALVHYTVTRKKLLDLLSSLTEVVWRRPVRHAIFGPTTLHELVSIIAGHDRLHVRQIQTTLQALHQR